MKKYFIQKLGIGVFLLCFSWALHAQDGRFGLGVLFGEPSGLSAKMWTSQHTALDAALAWTFKGAGWLHVHTDFLMHRFHLIDVENGQLPLYFGLGAYVGLSSNIALGARVPLGLAYILSGAPLEIFVELVPGLALIPGTDFYLGGGFGIRYYF